MRSQLARADANLTQAQARVRRLDGDFERAQGLYARNAIGREEYEKLRGDRDEAKAGVRVAESNIELARLNLKYTEIRAPFKGRIGRRLIDPRFQDFKTSGLKVQVPSDGEIVIEVHRPRRRRPLRSRRWAGPHRRPAGPGGSG